MCLKYSSISIRNRGFVVNPRRSVFLQPGPFGLTTDRADPRPGQDPRRGQYLGHRHDRSADAPRTRRRVGVFEFAAAHRVGLQRIFSSVVERPEQKVASLVSRMSFPPPGTRFRLRFLLAEVGLGVVDFDYGVLAKMLPNRPGSDPPTPRPAETPTIWRKTYSANLTATCGSTMIRSSKSTCNAFATNWASTLESARRGQGRNRHENLRWWKEHQCRGAGRVA